MSSTVYLDRFSKHLFSSKIQRKVPLEETELEEYLERQHILNEHKESS